MILTKYKRLTESETLDRYIIPKGYIIRCDNMPYYLIEDAYVLGRISVLKKENSEVTTDKRFKKWIIEAKKHY